MQVQLLRITENPEDLIALAALTTRSLQSRPRSSLTNQRLIYNLIKQGHESPLEHAYATFAISGISRACLAQLTRHRLASYSVTSQRYATPPLDQWTIPPSLPRELTPRTLKFLDETRKLYKALLKSGTPKEDARLFLPQATQTSLIMSANFREWRHIIRLRTAPDAQWEIRNLCTLIALILHQHAPSTFHDLTLKLQKPPNLTLTPTSASIP